MKYAIVIPDGAADMPLDELDGRTPLAAADTPNMDWIAANGRCGTVSNIPPKMAAGSDVAILSVCGYDPEKYYTGRAPLEAAARGMEVGPDQWIFRCNLVTVVDEKMEDYSAGHITTEEASALIAELNRRIDGDGAIFHAAVSYRHLLLIDGQFDVTTTPPHDILGETIWGHLPKGHGAETLRALMDRSQAIFAEHEINSVRRDLGENPATMIWLWGQGKMPQIERFEDRFSVRGAAITAVDLVRGISRLIGWDVIDVDGATGYIDTNYAGKGAAAVGALEDHDLVCVHVEAPDEAGHGADAQGKIEAISRTDEHIVGPLLERLRREGDEGWRILVLPDHPTPCSVRTHTHDPVPFAMAGARIESVVANEFTEAAAEESDLHVSRGCELMEFFLTVR